MAQKDKSTLTSDTDNDLATNGTGAITANILRLLLRDFLDSLVFKDTNDTALTSITDDISALQSSLSGVVSGFIPKGSWDASGGSFPGGGSAQQGWYYNVSVGGTVDSVEFAAGDSIFAVTDDAATDTYAANWQKIDQTDAVASVVGLTGAVSKSALLSALNVEDGAEVNLNGAATIALIDAVLGTSWKTGVPDFDGLTVRTALPVLGKLLFSNPDNSDAVEVIEWEDAAEDLVQELATRTLANAAALTANHRIVLTNPLAGAEDDQLVEIDRDDLVAYLETVLLPQRIEVTASRSLVVTDGNNELYSEQGSTVAMTLPLGQAQKPIIFHRDGTGAFNVTAVSGVTINGADGATVAIQTQNKSMVLRPKKAANTWVAEGDIA